MNCYSYEPYGKNLSSAMLRVLHLTKLEITRCRKNNFKASKKFPPKLALMGEVMYYHSVSLLLNVF